MKSTVSTAALLVGFVTNKLTKWCGQFEANEAGGALLRRVNVGAASLLAHFVAPDHPIGAMPRTLLALVLFACIASVCASFQTTNLTAGSGEIISVQVGGMVRVLAKHGARPRLEVTQIDPDALVGKHEGVRIEDVALLEVRHFSGGRTVGAIAAMIVVGAARSMNARVVGGVRTAREAARYKNVIAAADRRLSVLTQLQQSRGCVAPTSAQINPRNNSLMAEEDA